MAAARGSILMPVESAAFLLCLACGCTPENGRVSTQEAGALDSGQDGSLVSNWGKDSGLPDNVEPTRLPLPPRPAWNPDIPLGSPGWKQSTVPFCSEDVAFLHPFVWATPGEVYVAVNAACLSAESIPTCNWDPALGGYVGGTVYKNDGTGWKRIYRHSAGCSGPMEGYVDGRLALALGDCPQALIADDGTATCIWTGSADFLPLSATVTGGMLFVIGVDPPAYSALELWKYDGVGWTKTKTWSESTNQTVAPPSVTLINGFLVERDDAGVFWVGAPAQPDSVTPISGAPPGQTGGQWTYGGPDLLLGYSNGGVAHFDGAQWVLGASGFTGVLPKMWGAPDHTVFFNAEANAGVGFGRWSSGVGTPIFVSSMLSVDDFSGTTSTEVFLAVTDLSFSAYSCGSTFLLWYDGSVFHPF